MQEKRRSEVCRPLNDVPIFKTLAEALQESMRRYDLPPEAYQPILKSLEGDAAENDRWKSAMLDLFLCGEIAITAYDQSRGAVFTATEAQNHE